MNYIKVIAKLKPYTSDVADILMAKLGEKGFESFVETDEGFEAYVSEKCYTPEMIYPIKLPDSKVKISFQTELLPSMNWNEEWEKHYFQPIVIADQCLVRSPFHKYYPEMPIQIVIEPKMSFGTGHHETTSMMMQAILEIDLQGKRVLDMGCGSGILGILASIKGAGSVTAIDIDPWCTGNSSDNCRINNISNMEIIQGDASILEEMNPFDIIFANINRNILLSDIPIYAKKLKDNHSQLIISGFYNSDLSVISTVAKAQKLTIKSSKENNQWLLVTYEKQKTNNIPSPPINTN